MNVTRRDKIKNEYLRAAVGMANISGKLTERQLKQFWHVRRQHASGDNWLIDLDENTQAWLENNALVI